MGRDDDDLKLDAFEMVRQFDHIDDHDRLAAAIRDELGPHVDDDYVDRLIREVLRLKSNEFEGAAGPDLFEGIDNLEAAWA